MESKYYPGFQIAGSNSQLINARRLPLVPKAINQHGKQTYLNDLQRRKLKIVRATASVLGQISTETFSNISAVETWEDLSQEVAKSCINAVWNDISHADTATKSLINADRIKADIYQATSQIAATLDVISRLVVKRELDDPSRELHDIALKSRGFTMHGATLPSLVEADLVFGMASPKPNLSVYKPYEGIRYHEKWMMLNGKDQLCMRPEKAPDLRGLANNHPTIQEEPIAVWFGCPAIKQIPALYDSTVAIAHANGLLERSYTDARREIGLV